MYNIAHVKSTKSNKFLLKNNNYLLIFQNKKQLFIKQLYLIQNIQVSM